MYLLVAATELELEPARQALEGSGNVAYLLSGVGPVEAAFSLTNYLALHAGVTGVINFGVAGAYLHTGLPLLAVCMAGKEILADLGICLDDRIDPLVVDGLPVSREFDLQNRLLLSAADILKKDHIPVRVGTFLTVNCVSGTTRRGEQLQGAHQAICENMEGAALARICQGFGLDFLELRCVSNLVEDRDPSKWRLKEACFAAGDAAARVVKGLNNAEHRFFTLPQ